MRRTGGRASVHAASRRRPRRTGGPAGSRPGLPPRPGGPGRSRPGAGRDAAAVPDKIRQRRSRASRSTSASPQLGARPTLEKRFEEGERKLHPARTRPGVGERARRESSCGRRAADRARRAKSPSPKALPFAISPRSSMCAPRMSLKTLLDRGIFASINQALDVPTATSLAEVVQRRRQRRFV